MKWFRADLHIHSVLSPCGSLDMTPKRIVTEAIAKGLDIIAITDHNSTKQCHEIIEVGKGNQLLVIGGVEVNTKEEVHCLALFQNSDNLKGFQDYLDLWLPNIKNKPELFGHQVWVNKNEEILGEELRLLWSALNRSIDEVATKVVELNGIFIPAHIDRLHNGILRQLGFIPDDLIFDAVEVFQKEKIDKKWFEQIKDRYSIIASSDSHSPEQIGQRFTMLKMEKPTFEEVKLALRRVGGRDVKFE